MTVPELEEVIQRNPMLLQRGPKFISECYNIDRSVAKLVCSKIRTAYELHDFEDIKNINELVKMGKTPFAKIINTTKAKEPECPKVPKILILDIETAPLRAYVWSRWKQNIYLEQTISEWFMISWSAKWLFNPYTMSNVLTPKEAIVEDDKRICQSLWELLEEADIVIAHNGIKFDIPKINTRFLKHGLGPTTPYRQIDTKVVAAKQFGFSSNKLDALAMFFGFPTKIKTEFELWVDCLKGDEKALAEMERYNQYDVQLLEEVYLKLRPYIKNHPNLALYTEIETSICPNCGSHNLESTGGYYMTHTGKYETLRCECGNICRKRVNLFKKGRLKNTVLNTSY